jgi:hypothetical protein
MTADDGREGETGSASLAAPCDHQGMTAFAYDCNESDWIVSLKLDPEPSAGATGQAGSSNLR